MDVTANSVRSSAAVAVQSDSGAQVPNGSLMGSFLIASLILIAAVVGSWVFLKQDRQLAQLNLPALPMFAASPRTAISQNWVARAESAFAAGRVMEPASDNAYFYYAKALAEDAGNDAASAGVARVVEFLSSSAQQALFRNDWSVARAQARQLLLINPSDAKARDIIRRVDRFERIEFLGQQALAQLAEGRLVKPEGDSALDTYRTILVMDESSVVARQGIETISSRLLANAQSAAFADDHKTAMLLIAQVNNFAPDAPGLDETRKLVDNWGRMVADQSVKDQLRKAADALRAGRLVSPSGNNALDLFERVLANDKSSAPAKAGLAEVADKLVQEAQKLIQSGEFTAADRAIAQASRAGATSADQEALRDELGYQSRLAKARAGEFDDILPIRALKIRNQVTPNPPRRLFEGWVEVLFTVNESGQVADITVQGLTDPELEESATDALLRWRFEPYLDNGRPMPVRTGIRFTFQS